MSTTQGPKTWFADDSAPGDKESVRGGLLITLIGTAIFLPLALITAFGSYLAFTRFRVKHTVIYQLTALTTILFTLTGILQWSVTSYPGAIKTFLSTFTPSDEAPTRTMALLSLTGTSIPVSLVVGFIVGSIYCTIRWVRRSEWEDFDFRLTPLQKLRKQRTINNIKNNTDSPSSGGTLGVEKYGNRVIQTEDEASASTLITGASGSGKTTTRLAGFRDLIAQGSGVCIINFKGDPALTKTMAELAERFNRPFYDFSFHNPEEAYRGPAPYGPAFYDSLSRGDASRRKDMVVAGRIWNTDYHRLMVEEYLQSAFDVMIRNPHPTRSTLDDIIGLLHTSELADRARKIERNEHTQGFLQSIYELTSGRLNKDQESTYTSVRQELTTMRNSSAGWWLRKPPEGTPHAAERNISLTEIAHKGGVVVFSLDSLTYPEVARTLGNFIIGDLKTVASELSLNHPPQPFHVFIDEFAALGSETITNLINKARSSKMPISLATQTLGDLKRVDPHFFDQILGIVNCFIIHRPNTLEEAKIFAGITGPEKQWDVTLGVEHTSGLLGGIGKGAATGDARLQSRDGYKVQPQEFMELKTGECVYIAKSPDQRIVRVKVIPERDNLTTSSSSNAQRNDQILENLISIRNTPVDTTVGTEITAPGGAVTRRELTDDEAMQAALELRKAGPRKPAALTQRKTPTPPPTTRKPPVLPTTTRKPGNALPPSTSTRSRATHGLPAMPAPRPNPTLPGNGTPNRSLPPSRNTLPPAPTRPTSTNPGTATSDVVIKPVRRSQPPMKDNPPPRPVQRRQPPQK